MGSAHPHKAKHTESQSERAEYNGGIVYPCCHGKEYPDYIGRERLTKSRVA